MVTLVNRGGQAVPSSSRLNERPCGLLTPCQQRSERRARAAHLKTIFHRLATLPARSAPCALLPGRPTLWVVLTFSNETCWQPVPRKRVTSCGSSSSPCWTAFMSVVLWARLWSVIASAQSSCFSPPTLAVLRCVHCSLVIHGFGTIIWDLWNWTPCLFSSPSLPPHVCLTGLTYVGSWSWHANTDPPLPSKKWREWPYKWSGIFSLRCVVHRQLYAQEAACRLQAADRDGKSLQRLSKEEFCKMMLPDSPPREEKSRKVRSVTVLALTTWVLLVVCLKVQSSVQFNWFLIFLKIMQIIYSCIIIFVVVDRLDYLNSLTHCIMDING